MRRLVVAAALAALSTTATTTGAYATPDVQYSQVTYYQGPDVLRQCAGDTPCGMGFWVLPDERYLHVTVKSLLGTASRVGAIVYTGGTPVHICVDTASGPLDLDSLPPYYGTDLRRVRVYTKFNDPECDAPLAVTVQLTLTVYYSKTPVSLATAIATATPSEDAVREPFNG